MKEFENVSINRSHYALEHTSKKGTITVFMYTGSSDPKTILDKAIKIYTQNNDYHEFIDSNLDNPWTRVIMSDVNGMHQMKFQPKTHRINESSN